MGPIRLVPGVAQFLTFNPNFQEQLKRVIKMNKQKAIRRDTDEDNDAETMERIAKTALSLASRKDKSITKKISFG